MSNATAQTDLDPEINATPVSDTTITNINIPDEVQTVRDHFNVTCTFTIKKQKQDIIDLINADRDEDHEISGTVEGIVGEEILITIDDANNSIQEEYGHNKIKVGHELWLLRYGGDAVETITEESDEFNDYIVVKMFNINRLIRPLHDVFKRNNPKRFHEIIDNTETTTEAISYIVNNEDVFDFNIFPETQTEDETDANETDRSNSRLGSNAFSEDLPDKDTINTKYET